MACPNGPKTHPLTGTVQWLLWPLNNQWEFVLESPKTCVCFVTAITKIHWSGTRKSQSFCLMFFQKICQMNKKSIGFFYGELNWNKFFFKIAKVESCKLPLHAKIWDHEANSRFGYCTFAWHAIWFKVGIQRGPCLFQHHQVVHLIIGKQGFKWTFWTSHPGILNSTSGQAVSLWCCRSLFYSESVPHCKSPFLHWAFFPSDFKFLFRLTKYCCQQS